MESSKLKTKKKQLKRQQRVRRQIKGKNRYPRLSVNKTNTNIYAQIIDDEIGKTLGSFSTLDKEFRSDCSKSKDAALKVGSQIGEIAKSLKIDRMVFDRGRYKYHGIVTVLADAVREKGIQL